MRRKVCLNGEWNFMPEYRNVDADLAVEECCWEKTGINVPSSWRWMIKKHQEYQPYDLFSYPTKWNDAEAGVIRRFFCIKKKENERIFIIFNGVMQRSVFYINSKKVKESEEAFLPIEIDITDNVWNGNNNEVKVWCAPFRREKTETGSKVLAPCGSWFGNLARGIWQDVFLEYRPQVFISDVFIKTSVRESKIMVTCSLNNAKQEHCVQIKMCILDENGLVKEAYMEPEFTEDGTYASVSIRWEDAIYWSPDNPKLYMLRLTLIVDGKLFDVVEKRYGFREVWVEGHKFYLNGIRTNLRGDSWHYQGFVQQTREYAVNWFKACKDMGMNFVRLHAMPYPEFYLDVADETGMLVIDESAIYGSGKMMLASHTHFIDNCASHLKNLVLRDRNHPSIVIWSMQNEMRWVDGRNGYKSEMKRLSDIIRKYDGTRPILYDGDNRLVDPEDMEIISMHYNIDGTVASWNKTRPLIFGEHGKWHYISPQVAAGIGGGTVYNSFDKCLEALGLEEQHFIEYARKEEVTGICPFNMSNYMMWTMPEQDMKKMPSLDVIEGVNLPVVRKHSLTINNGLIGDSPAYTPNPSWEPVSEACRNICIIADEYNNAFFGGSEVKRKFQIYNDSEMEVNACITYWLALSNGKTVIEGKIEFIHEPGERKEFELELALPDCENKEMLEFTMELYHGCKMVYCMKREYTLYPAAYKTSVIDCRSKKINFIGDNESYRIVRTLLPTAQRTDMCTSESLRGTDFVIIGRNLSVKAKEIQPVLDCFVQNGGFLLVLEQHTFAPGELVLSGKRFYNAFINDKKHPVFKDLEEKYLCHWGEKNANYTEIPFMVENAFKKPVTGDMKILLECGEGDFGWGGLLWTPLIEYTIGKGKTVLSQLELVNNFDRIPAACCMLRNLITYGLGHESREPIRTGMMTHQDSYAEKWFNKLGLQFEIIGETTSLNEFSLILIDPAAILSSQSNRINQYIEDGGQVVVLPLKPVNQNLLYSLCSEQAKLIEKPVYQLISRENEFTRGISASDLYLFEKVTYTPENYRNSLIAQFCLELEGESVLESAQNPWYDYFVCNGDAEYIKMSIASMNLQNAFKPERYGVVIQKGKGQLLFIQVMLQELDKVRRIYSRMLSNIGAGICSRFFSYMKTESDLSIGMMMALQAQDHINYSEMEKYFSDPNYTLNNLGEGVYGWMKRLEKENGFITIPGSAGRTFFLTVFIDSEINRNPEKREENELPDSSIVPDLFLKANCACKLFVNGQCYLDRHEDEDVMKELKIDDVVLFKGINRLALVIRGAQEDAKLNISFKNKYGDFMEGLKYYMTLD